MLIKKTIGNAELLKLEKTLFICSKRTPIQLYEYVFQWTDSLSYKDCIACFNSTEMETEVLKALLVARIPTILFVMNRFADVNNYQIEQALEENRILIVVLKRNEPHGKGYTPRLRNEYVLSLCKHVVCGYVNKNGSVFPLLAGRQGVRSLIDDKAELLAAETYTRHERWTVAQDKLLLRMYYDDMGIHAIHKRLRRNYLSIYTRIRSITLPEDVLKGREFEDYVLEMFNLRVGNSFILKEWQGDKVLGEIYPENNRHPDFVFEYEGKVFAVECKWRERLSLNIEKDLFFADKIAIYQQFSVERNIPVFIILGVGGEPSTPELLFNIPLSAVGNIISQTKAITDFQRRSVEKPFEITDFFPIERKKQSRKGFSMKEIRTKYPNAYRP